jgi:Uncharacterized protein conserved in bacteria (DUF2188)
VATSACRAHGVSRGASCGYRSRVGEGVVHVAPSGVTWTVSFADGSEAVIEYATRRDAVEAGGRIAAAAGSRLVLNLGGVPEAPPLTGYSAAA